MLVFAFTHKPLKNLTFFLFPKQTYKILKKAQNVKKRSIKAMEGDGEAIFPYDQDNTPYGLKPLL